MTDAPRKGHPLLRPFFFLLGLVLTGVGIVGVIAPGWPGTIFLILAAGCFARSSPKLEAWLVNHPRFGPTVVAWRQHGAIPRKIKFIAIGSMILSFVIVLFAHMEPVWMWVIGLCLLASALFVGSRPEGPKRAG
ncbi:MAG: hypothetical protein B7Z38_02755 [Rhodobacterales bacterium 12-64-8]|nr:MAG: hypothetical protein B7Z38_02755 [Rhodobacterales bacterium 12-64-8]OYX50492.1 MAG: hypothetical protein B7Y90_04020 [Alphaproteobacteria bacterium 32-64-14]